MHAPPPPQVQIVQLGPPSNAMAITSMVLGIVSAVLSWTIILLFITIPMAIVGLIFGFLGLAKAKELGGRGKGMATAGIVLCGLPFAIGIVLVLITDFGAIGAGVTGSVIPRP